MNMRGAPMGDLQTSALSAEDSNRRRPEATSTVAAKDDNATQNADLEDVVRRLRRASLTSGHL